MEWYQLLISTFIRCLWLASCYSRNITDVTYISDIDPVGSEVIWSLGAGCRQITKLVIPPMFPKYVQFWNVLKINSENEPDPHLSVMKFFMAIYEFYRIAMKNICKHTLFIVFNDLLRLFGYLIFWLKDDASPGSHDSGYSPCFPKLSNLCFLFSQNPHKFTNHCAFNIARCWPDLQTLSLGGVDVTARGLAAIGNPSP